MLLDLTQAVEALCNGGVVAIPTETVYGLAGNALNISAVDKIYKAKGRPSSNPLILHFANLEQTEPYVIDWPEPLLKLAQQYSPGPITFLVSKTKAVPNRITAGSDRVAIRFPKHEITHQLLSQLDFPLAAPSANKSGYISPTSATMVEMQLGNKINGVVDGGRCSGGIESTIVGFNGKAIELFRHGLISQEQIEKATGIEVIEKSIISEEHLEAPGMMKSHYAPDTRTILVEDIDAEIKLHKGLEIALISLTPQSITDVAFSITLSKNGGINEIAHNLYSAMFEMDQKNADIIIIEKAPNEGLGKALNDRLKRAVADKG